MENVNIEKALNNIKKITNIFKVYIILSKIFVKIMLRLEKLRFCKIYYVDS